MGGRRRAGRGGGGGRGYEDRDRGSDRGPRYGDPGPSGGYYNDREPPRPSYLPEGARREYAGGWAPGPSQDNLPAYLRDARGARDPGPSQPRRRSRSPPPYLRGGRTPPRREKTPPPRQMRVWGKPAAEAPHPTEAAPPPVVAPALTARTASSNASERGEVIASPQVAQSPRVDASPRPPTAGSSRAPTPPRLEPPPSLPPTPQPTRARPRSPPVGPRARSPPSRPRSPPPSAPLARRRSASPPPRRRSPSLPPIPQARRRSPSPPPRRRSPSPPPRPRDDRWGGPPREPAGRDDRWGNMRDRGPPSGPANRGSRDDGHWSPPSRAGPSREPPRAGPSRGRSPPPSAPYARDREPEHRDEGVRRRLIEPTHGAFASPRPIAPPTGPFADRAAVNPERAAYVNAASDRETRHAYMTSAPAPPVAPPADQPRRPGQPSAIFLRNRRPRELALPSLTPDLDAEIAAVRAQRFGPLMLNDFAMASAARHSVEDTHLFELEARAVREASRLAQASLDRVNAELAGVAAA